MEWLTSLQTLLSDHTVLTPANLARYGEGLTTTVQLVFLSLIAGLILAVPLAIGRGSKRRWIKLPIYGYTYVFRGTPLLVQLYMIYYGLPSIDALKDWKYWDYVDQAHIWALLAFTLNTAAYTTEIFHGAIKTTPRGEIEAAKAYGMSWGLRMRRIILPSAFRRALPAYGNEVIFMLHASAVASVVTIMDLTGAARFIVTRTYAAFQPYLFVAVIYLCLTFAILYLFRYLEKRLLAHLRPVEG